MVLAMDRHGSHRAPGAQPHLHLRLERLDPLLATVLFATAACAAQPAVPDKPSPSLLCIVRHAQAYKNLVPPPEGLAPQELDSLTSKGRAQARALRSQLPKGVARILSSPAGRARETRGKDRQRRL